MFATAQWHNGQSKPAYDFQERLKDCQFGVFCSGLRMTLCGIKLTSKVTASKLMNVEVELCEQGHIQKKIGGGFGNEAPQATRPRRRTRRGGGEWGGGVPSPAD